jgi:hypothetical protein
MVEPLPSRSVTEKQDEFICTQLRANATSSHELIIKPNIWMQDFTDEDPEFIKRQNAEIIKLVRENEEKYRKLRNEKGFKTLGPGRLRKASIDLSYTPKKNTPAVFVITNDAELRKEILACYWEFCEHCAWCYEQWELGNYSVLWPPGAYAPVGIPHANFFAFD